MTRFTEVGDRVWVAHYDWMHVNVTLVGGGQGLLMVDTHGSERMAREVADDVRRLGAGPLTAVVNTHEHWDHTFGNVVMSEAFGPLPIHAHDWAAEHTVAAGERAKQQFRDEPDDPHAEEVLETRIVAADQTFSSVRILDLGDRQVELIHPGRGHTAGDLVVRVPDADVLAAGDLVEQSDPPVHRRRQLAVRVAHDDGPGARLPRRRHGGRARATGSSSTRSSCTTSAPSSASSRRRSATSRAAAYPSTRRWPPATGPGPGSPSSTRSGSATTSSPAPRSASPSSDAARTVRSRVPNRAFLPQQRTVGAASTHGSAGTASA